MPFLKNILKRAAKAAGYSIRNLDTQQYGVDLWLDVGKLSKAMDRPIDVVFDVGANAGDTTRRVKKEFPSSTVYAFEPHPKTFLELASAISGLDKVNPIPLALSDRTGRCTLFDYGGSGHVNSLNPDSRFAKRFKLQSTELSVETSTVDEYCEVNRITNIGLLKIDAEGNDYAVLAGARRMLETCSIDFVYFEFNDLLPKSGAQGGSLLEMGRLLGDSGFHFVATYTDYILADGEFFVVANALMVRA